MISGSQVRQVTRAVAQGDGDWANVPRCIREAIVLSLSRSPETAAIAAQGLSTPRTPNNNNNSNVRHARPSNRAAAVSPVPPVLTEEVVERSVQTFEDGTWLRDQAVRSYAQFHNSVEALYTAMSGQLYPLWRTSMQLNHDVLEQIREHYGAAPTDVIPDGIALDDEVVERVEAQEAVLDDLVFLLDRLRGASVRFAAHYLSDTEKLAMGTNPAYLQPEEVDREWGDSRRHSGGKHRGASSSTLHAKKAAATPCRAELGRSSSHSSSRHLAEMGRQCARRQSDKTSHSESLHFQPDAKADFYQDNESPGQRRPSSSSSSSLA